VNLPPAEGVYQFIDGAKRYRKGQLPANVTGSLFESTDSIFALDTTPPSDLAPDYPCEGCPSSGGAAS
jgi:hypothetical protein